MTVRRPITIAFLYGLIGLAAFGRILNTQFLSDDWEFLIIVEKAPSVLTCFEPLVGLFIRPLVVFFYYLHFKTFGLHAFPYHLTLVLVHVLNAWLVYRLALLVDAERRHWFAVSAGLLFLLFAGHAEAVSWAAGVADPVLAPSLIGSLFVFARGLDADRPWRWFACGWALFVLGMLAKETGAIQPGLIVVYALLHASRTHAWRRVAIRTAAYVTVPGTLLILFLWMRTRVFGDVFAVYDLGPSTFSPWIASAFVFRAYLPPMEWIAVQWLAQRHLAMLAGGAVIFGIALVVARLTGRDWRGLLFSLAAASIALLPVLPLSISILTTESERYVYIASIFTCLALAQFVAIFLPPRAAVVALVLVSCVHALYLNRANAALQEAGRLTDGILQSSIEILRGAETAKTRQVYLLNSVDNVRGAYVFRRGLRAALHLHAPDLDRWAIHPFVSQQAASGTAHYPARQLDERTFELSIRPEYYGEVTPPPIPHTEFPAWSIHGFTVRFQDSVPRALVMALDRGRMHVLGRVSGLGLPMGVIDVPTEPASCKGDDLRIAGWALDDDEVARVVVERAGEPGKPAEVFGTAEWTYNTRPDVAAIYPGFPHLDKAGWAYFIPCTTVMRAPNRTLRVKVVAIDDQGHRSELGVRTIGVGQ